MNVPVRSAAPPPRPPPRPRPPPAAGAVGTQYARCIPAAPENPSGVARQSGDVFGMPPPPPARPPPPPPPPRPPRPPPPAPPPAEAAAAAATTAGSVDIVPTTAPFASRISSVTVEFAFT